MSIACWAKKLNNAWCQSCFWVRALYVLFSLQNALSCKSCAFESFTRFNEAWEAVWLVAKSCQFCDNGLEFSSLWASIVCSNYGCRVVISYIIPWLIVSWIWASEVCVQNHIDIRLRRISRSIKGLKGLDKVLEGWFLLEMGGLAVVLSRHGGLLFGLQSHYLLDWHLKML